MLTRAFRRGSVLCATAALAAAAAFAPAAAMASADGAALGGHAVALNCRQYHAGHVLGDGEYSEGAIQTARNVSCAHALALVRPRYKWIVERESKTVNQAAEIPPFHLGPFTCRYTPEGPDTLKTCTRGAARFTFV
jgi:hypothetical protein